MSRIMRTATFALALAVLLFGAPAYGGVIYSYSATLTVDGVYYNMSDFISIGPDGYGRIEGLVYEGFNPDTGDPEWECHIDMIVMDPDPSITYTYSMIDFGAPSTFMFDTMINAIVPTGSPNTVENSIGIGLTDFSGDGVSITPAVPDGAGNDFDGIDEMARAYLGTPESTMTVDVGPGGSFPGPAPPGAFYSYMDFDSNDPGPTAPGGGWTQLRVLLDFTMSGGRDALAITGRAEILGPVIPEPSSFVLGGLAIVGLSVAGLRRRWR